MCTYLFWVCGSKICRLVPRNRKGMRAPPYSSNFSPTLHASQERLCAAYELCGCAKMRPGVEPAGGARCSSTDGHRTFGHHGNGPAMPSCGFLDLTPSAHNTRCIHFAWGIQTNTLIWELGLKLTAPGRAACYSAKQPLLEFPTLMLDALRSNRLSELVNRVLLSRQGC